MQCLKFWIKNNTKLKLMMNVKKPNVPKYLYEKFVTQVKQNIVWIWNKDFFFHILNWKKNHKIQCDYDSKIVFIK